MDAISSTHSSFGFIDLRILATSDVHMRITGWDAQRDELVPEIGMDALATSIHAARDTAPGACVLLDNGDAVQGTALDKVCVDMPAHIIHPWPAILNTLRYDAVGLGNHDFDFGLLFLKRIAGQINAPVLCASLTGQGVSGVSPTTVLHRSLTCSTGQQHTLRIGITSVLPPQTLTWNQRHLAGHVEFRDGIVAARHAVDHLRDLGADLVIVLCHSGLPMRDDDTAENFAGIIAEKVQGIDALIMGHTHQRFPGRATPADVHGVPAVMPGQSAEALGVIDLQLQRTTTGWDVVNHTAALHTPEANIAPDTTIARLAAPVIKKTRAKLKTILSQTDTGLHSYFDMLQTGPSGALVARAMMQTIAARVAGTDMAHLPLLASVAPMALGGTAGPRNFVEVPPGAVRMRHIAMLLPFANVIWAMVLKGTDLWRWAERSAAYFSADTGTTGRLVNPAVPAFNFEALYGLETVFDPLQPPMFSPSGHLIDATARRVRSMTYNGQPLDPDARFLVAMTSYRGAGGGSFPGVDGNSTILTTETEVSEALRLELSTSHVLDRPVDPVWRFTRGTGATVTVETSPNAISHLSEIAHFDPQAIQVNSAGFLELRVTI